MSTLSSWIDHEELSELMPFLLPEKQNGSGSGKSDELPETEQSAESPEAAPPEASSPEAAPPEAASPEAVEGAVENGDLGDSALETAGEESTGSEAMAGITGAEIDFNSPDAYDAGAFPEAGDPAAQNSDPARQAAAVQASVTLERARNRADEVGLLKGNSGSTGKEDELEAPGSEPEAAAESVPVEDEDTGTEIQPGPAEGEAGDTQPAEPTDPNSGTFRDRMARFASAAVKLTNGSNPAVTDFQSYPLYPGTNGGGASSPHSVKSILRMNQLIAQLPDHRNGDRGNTAQIALSNGQWLCILTQDSASGGVCASLQIPSPLSAETADRLHQGLREALVVSEG